MDQDTPTTPPPLPPPEKFREATCLELSREELLVSPTMQTLREEIDSPTEQGEEWCQEEEVYWPIFYASFRIPKEDEKEEEKKEPRPLPTVPIKCCL